MKNSYSVYYIKKNNSDRIATSLSILNKNYYKISEVLMYIEKSYINYYIEEITKVIKGNRRDLTIMISDEYDISMDHLFVESEYSYSKYQGKIGERIESQELLEFLKIIKRELKIGDEMVVDPRCEG